MKAISILMTLLLVAGTGVTYAQSPAFSYQGSITESGAPGNGTFQMQFRLFDAAAGGNQIGSTVTVADVNVSDGVFGVRLDFGAGAFSGADRFLEIAVRRNSGQSYTNLSPRQQIASSPYSIRTLSAAQADVALDSQKLGGVNASEYVTNTSLGNSVIRNQTMLQSSANFNISGDGYFGGRIGIGTNNPLGPLHLQSTFTFAPLYLTSAFGFASQSSWRLQPDAGIAGQGAAFGVYSNTAQAYRLFINGSGNVGIGTTAPTSRLDILGQDGMQITGFQPFITFRDGNNNNLAARIQSADGKLVFRPNSGGTSIPAVVIEANGNLTQPLGRRGISKAFLRVSSNGTIIRCYNGYTNNSTGNCGFTVTNTGPGDYVVNIGQQIITEFSLVQGYDGIGIGATHQVGTDGNIYVRTFATDIAQPSNRLNWSFTVALY